MGIFSEIEAFISPTKGSSEESCNFIDQFSKQLNKMDSKSILVFLCIVSISYGYIVRTGIPIGWNYGVAFGVTTSLENVIKFCQGINLNTPEPMSVSMYSAVQSCKVLMARMAREEAN